MKRPAMGSKGNKTLKKDELNKKALRKVNSTNLKKLGEVSLKEKIQNAVEEHSDEETQAIVLHQSMTPGEKSNAWNLEPAPNTLEKVWE